MEPAISALDALLTPPPRPARHRGRRRLKQRLVAAAHELGPGVVTGAADDDPSGIATYSQAGAQFGYGLLWTMLLTFPLMSAVQLVSAHIGRVTGQGLARNLTAAFPKLTVLFLLGILVVANTINIGAWEPPLSSWSAAGVTGSCSASRSQACFSSSSSRITTTHAF